MHCRVSPSWPSTHAAAPESCQLCLVQEIFIHYGNDVDAAPSENNALYAALSPEVQALVRPYFDSKFSLISSPVPPGPIFGAARGSTFQKWIYNWPRQLIMQHATGALPLCTALECLSSCEEVHKAGRCLKVEAHARSSELCLEVLRECLQYSWKIFCNPYGMSVCYGMSAL